MHIFGVDFVWIPGTVANCFYWVHYNRLFLFPIPPKDDGRSSLQNAVGFSAREENLQNFSPNYEISGFYEPFTLYNRIHRIMSLIAILSCLNPRITSQSVHLKYHLTIFSFFLLLNQKFQNSQYRSLVRQAQPQVNKWTYMKLINLNCITSSCNWNTYVTWRDNEYELPEDDTKISKHVEAWYFIN